MVLRDYIEENRKRKKIRLAESPYAFARVTVMRTLLIPAADYPKLIKMSIPEIGAYLSETQYRKEIDEYGGRLSGIELVESALFLNLRNTVKKLKQISPSNYNLLIDRYMLHYDVDNIKTVLRAKSANMKYEEIKNLLFPSATVPLKNLEIAFNKGSVDEIIKSLPYPFDNMYNEYKRSGSKNIMQAETILDRIYFNEMLSFAEQVPKDGQFFREFIYNLIQVNNVMIFLRLKREGMQNKEIQDFLFFTKDEIENMFLRQLLKTKSNEDIAKLISKSRYNQIIKINNISDVSLIDIQIRLNKYVYKRAVHSAHENPFSVYTVLSYLLGKEIEINNILRIIKAKYFGINAERIEPIIITK